MPCMGASGVAMQLHKLTSPVSTSVRLARCTHGV